MPVAVPFESIDWIPTTDGETFVTISGIDIASFGVESCAIVGRFVLSTSDDVSLAELLSFLDLLLESLSELDVPDATGLLPVISVYPTIEVVPIAITLSTATIAVRAFFPFEALGFFGE